MSGADEKLHIFVYRSFPSTGGPGVSTQTLIPGRLRPGHRPCHHRLSPLQVAGVGDTSSVRRGDGNLQFNGP